jgi:ABC-type sugar transport system substrate-binding protein
MRQAVNWKGLLMLVLCLVLVLAGCSSSKNDSSSGSSSGQSSGGSASSESGSGSSSGDSGKKFRIGVTHYALKNEFTVLISDAQKAKAAELGVDIEIFDGNYDVNTQISQFENMIAQGFDAIVFSPVDVEAMAVAVDKAVDAGIPVIGVNTRVNSDKLTSYVGSNDVTAGEMEMEFIAEKIGGKGNIVILEGPIGQSAQIQRREGIHNILEKYPDIKVLAEKTANWSRAEGLSLMENWLQTFDGQINAVVGQNDEMALGALQALEGKGLNDRNAIPVIGVDGIADALQAVKDGRMNASVFQDAKGQGEMSIEVAVKYLKGEQIENEYWIPFQLVTPENVDEFMNN